uniref:Cytochrome c oxidase subunit 2 n=1 Tax=Amplexidiscus fenestrafer TaxID=51823 RepID=A0A0F7DXA0_AMPFE|nr:cytochrome c oxidase subunit II [Amplexidiscus fenestrafer]AKF78555.1 cytochrome c oxidase subunit II [Amplexidiscus fenestrafer]
MLNSFFYIVNICGKRDIPEPWHLGLQDAADPVMEEIIFFHDQIMFLLVIIIIVVLWLIVEALNGESYDRNLINGTLLEIVWTIIPAIILVFIASPSLKLLYLMDEIVGPALTIKAVGHQWYWSYEYSDYQEETLEFDSYMVPTSDLNSGDFRLLEVDYGLIVPIKTHVRILVTAADVLHSFAVPALGLKIDAVPGRLNQAGLFVKRPGLFYGQCSELCGANHSFMPIVIEAVSLDRYINWILSLSQDKEGF